MATGQTTVGVTPVGDTIEVRFSYQGKTYRPRLQLKPTKAHLLHANRLRQAVMQSIADGTFNILEHFPDYKFAKQVRLEAPAEGRTFAEWVTVWETLSARDLEHSTLSVYKRHMKAYWLPKFGPLDPANITNEAILTHLAGLATDKKLGRKTQNNILIPLRKVFQMISRSPGAGPDPTDGIENMKVQTGNPDPFTLEEVELALADVRKRCGDALADYYEFAAFAGLRVSEQIALLWGDVDLRTATIVVRRSRVMTQDKARTKTTVERTVELNDRATAVLERQRARTQIAGKHVFVSTNTGKPWHDEQTQRKEWATTMRRTQIRHRPPKELRDSSVTFALSAGADPWYVARQHGHSLTVMVKDYAKWIPNADRGRNRAAINSAIGGSTKKEGTNEN